MQTREGEWTLTASVLKPPKRGRGRPPSPDAAKVYLSFRVTPAKVNDYRAAAAKEKTTLSAWLRGLADRAAAYSALGATERRGVVRVARKGAVRSAKRARRNRRG